jgi:membrane protein DedA with SNARE-associated domain
MTEWAQEALEQGGYVLLALLILLENLFPPIPSEVILPLAGARVASGDLSFGLAVVAATAGSVAGALVLYALGRHGGRPLLLSHGRLLRLDAAKLAHADAWFDRHGAKIVFLGRLVPGVRSLVSVPAGLGRMGVARFVALTAAGSALWNALLIGAGWALGARWRQVSDAVGTATPLVLGAVVGAVAVAVAVGMRRRRRAPAPADRGCGG